MFLDEKIVRDVWCKAADEYNALCHYTGLLPLLAMIVSDYLYDLPSRPSVAIRKPHFFGPKTLNETLNNAKNSRFIDAKHYFKDSSESDSGREYEMLHWRNYWKRERLPFLSTTQSTAKAQATAVYALPLPSDPKQLHSVSKTRKH